MLQLFSTIDASDPTIQSWEGESQEERPENDVWRGKE